jgi:ribonuclease BN (tRNA processing enzyme)
MKLTIVGSGDAFGSGGRLQTSFHLAIDDWNCLIDCGATTLIGMSRLGLNPNDVAAIFISHLHGDHFSGLVWWMLHARHVAKRSAPLTIVAPRGIKERYRAATEALFPGSSERDLGFELEFIEHDEAHASEVGPASVAVVPVRHPSGAPSYALRLTAAGKTISYSGDTEWVDELAGIAKDADIYISECYSFDKAIPHHMNWHDISSRLDALNARRVVLTHMGEDMLAHADEAAGGRVIIAEDGLVIEV